MERRRFLGVAALLGVPAVPALDSWLEPASPVADAGYPRNDLARVQAVVGASHGNLAAVRELVEEQPALAKSSWDWGFGDWESALGAAAHTGRREIADFLIAHGARPNIFSTAMMGEVDAVRAYLAADPSLVTLHGPHGISLLRHARAGGDEAQAVVDYLLDLVGPEEDTFGFPGDDALHARYGGTYRFNEPVAFDLMVEVRNGFLLVGAAPRPFARVLPIGEHAFHPTGAPAVRIEFNVEGEQAGSATIVDGPTRSTGTRVSQ